MIDATMAVVAMTAVGMAHVYALALSCKYISTDNSNPQGLTYDARGHIGDVQLRLLRSSPAQQQQQQQQIIITTYNI